MRELIQAFQQTVHAQSVADYDGYVANFIGDCVLAYFGWPRAHEDDAERAVRAGSALVQALGGAAHAGGRGAGRARGHRHRRRWWWAI